MNPKIKIGGLIVFVLLIIFYSATFVVREGQQALTLRLGKVMKNTSGQADVYQPGLHFKLPFIVRDIKFDVRIHNTDAETSKIPTDQQKYLLVDYYAKWKINNLPLYYTRTGGYSRRAQILLKQKINDALRAAFGKRSLKEVVSAERLNVMSILKNTANRSANNLGIEVIDVRIKGIDLLQQVQESVFQRMRTKREQVATQYRYQGRAQAEKIKANADAKARVMVATAKTEAQKTKASGDAKSSKIYTSAYNKDSQFYAFYRSLQAYKQVFINKNTIMILRSNSSFFKYLGLEKQEKHMQ